MRVAVVIAAERRLSEEFGIAPRHDVVGLYKVRPGRQCHQFQSLGFADFKRRVFGAYACYSKPFGKALRIIFYEFGYGIT